MVGLIPVFHERVCSVLIDSGSRESARHEGECRPLMNHFCFVRSFRVTIGVNCPQKEMYLLKLASSGVYSSTTSKKTL